jgi:hypothetical protein
MRGMRHEIPEHDAAWAERYAGEGDSGGMDLVGFVRANVRVFATITVVVALGTAGALVAALAAPPLDRVASMDITPTFPGAREGRYPNRAPYSPQDIVANAIVEPVWRSQGLDGAVSLAELCRNIQVVQGGRGVEAVRSEYVQKLSNAKLTAAERTALEAEFAARMKAVNAATVTISISDGSLGLPPAKLAMLLAAIPVEWARVSDASGASAYGFPVPSAKELRQSLQSVASHPGATENLLHAERLKEHVDSLVEVGSAIAQLPGSSGIRDAAGGSPVDLSQELEAIKRNLVIPAYIDSMAAARALDPSGFAAIRSTRTRLLESELEQARERARVLRAAYGAYVGETSLRSTDRAASGEGRDSGIRADIDASFIDRVIEQAVRNQDIEYRRGLSDRSVAAELEVVERSAQLEFEVWLDREVQSRQAGVPATVAGTENLARLTDRVTVLTERAQEFLRVLSARNLNPASAMFRVESPVAFTVVRHVEPRTVALWGVAAWFVASAMAVAVITLRSRSSTQPIALLGEHQAPAQQHVAASVGGLPPRRDPDARRLPQGPREPVG